MEHPLECADSCSLAMSWFCNKKCRGWGLMKRTVVASGLRSVVLLLLFIYFVQDVTAEMGHQRISGTAFAWLRVSYVRECCEY